jgi:hypothetical protein
MELIDRIPEGYTKGPWEADAYTFHIATKDHNKLFDTRGWGYLTGNGAGGLGLSTEEAELVQMANSKLAALAPELADEVKRLARCIALAMSNAYANDDGDTVIPAKFDGALWDVAANLDLDKEDV